MIGLPLFSGMHATGPGKWSGQIYNADDGSYLRKQASSVTGPDTPAVEGCVGALCGGETWTRVGRYIKPPSLSARWPPRRSRRGRRR